MYRSKWCDSFPFRAVFCLPDVRNLVKKAGKGRVGEGAGAFIRETLQLSLSLLAAKYFGMWGRCEDDVKLLTSGLLRRILHIF